MKTIAEWIRTLDDDVAEKAAHYVLDHNENPDGVFDCPQPTLQEALSKAFTWSETAEGDWYWEGIANGAILSTKEIIHNPDDAIG